MKKILILILALVLSLSSFSCKSNGQKALDGLGNLINNALEGNLDGLENALDGFSGSGNNNVSFGKAANYSEAYNQLTVIEGAANTMLQTLNDKQNEGFEYGQEGHTGIFGFMILMSLDLAFTAALNEDPAVLAGVKLSYSFLSAEIEHPRENEYIIKYTTEDGDIRTNECKFDVSTGSLSFVEKKNGEIFNFYEFINLGSDKYAFQTRGERALINYKDGVILNLAYSSYNVYDGSDDQPYDYAKVAVYPKGSGADASWVFADGVESYRNSYQYDGNILKIDTNPVWGDGLHISISAK